MDVGRDFHPRNARPVGPPLRLPPLGIGWLMGAEDDGAEGKLKA